MNEFETPNTRRARLNPSVKKHPGYEYLEVEVVDTLTQTANQWADDGWETVAVMRVSSTDRQLGFTDCILVKRVKQNPYDPRRSTEEFQKWNTWEKLYGYGSEEDRMRAILDEWQRVSGRHNQ